MYRVQKSVYIYSKALNKIVLKSKEECHLRVKIIIKKCAFNLVLKI